MTMIGVVSSTDGSPVDHPESRNDSGDGSREFSEFLPGSLSHNPYQEFDK